MTGILRRRQTAWLVVVVACALALVAIDAGPGPDGRRASAEPVRNATIVVEEGGARTGFATPEVTVGGGGTVTVVNLDSMDHTVTSVARAADGTPLFDVRVPAGTSATVPGVEALSAGAWAFYCKFHPNMRGTITVEGVAGGVEPVDTRFEQPLVVPRARYGADIRLVMRRAEVRVLPHGPRTSMWTYGGTYPGPDHRAARRARHPGHLRQPACPRRPARSRSHQHGGHQRRPTTASRRRYLIRHGSERTYDYPLTDGGRAAARRRCASTTTTGWTGPPATTGCGLQGMFLTTDPPDAASACRTGSTTCR